MSDRDRDGAADSTVLVADGLQLPHGITFKDGALYVGEEHSVTRLIDADLDGVAESRGAHRHAAARSATVSLHADDRFRPGREALRLDRLDLQRLRGRGRAARRDPPLRPRRHNGAVSSPADCATRSASPCTLQPASCGRPTTVATSSGTTTHPRRSTSWAKGTTPVGRTAPAPRRIRRSGSPTPARHGPPAGGDPGALGSAGVDVLRRHAVPDRVPRRPVRRPPRLVEPLHAGGLQGHSPPVPRRATTGEALDFATGWLDGATPSGRPVDLTVGSDGSLYVSDDHGGRIYRISYQNPVEGS